MELLERPVVAERDMTLILAALTALKKGDGSLRLPAEWTGAHAPDSQSWPKPSATLSS
jgi:hypothetical protein